MNDETGAQSAFARLLNVVVELRQRCPWDREQKLADTPRHLIEEAYEAADAIARLDSSEIADELGDLIVQSLFAGVILAEQGNVSVASVLRDATDKLVRRHPHIYAGAKADTVEQVLDNWDRIKQSEREEKKKHDAQSLAHVGRALPAVMRAERLGEKARRLGMDWANVRDVMAKVREEAAEVEAALDRGDNDSALEEIGDMMLALANAPRFIGGDGERTLRAACDKFVARFDSLAKLAADRGLDLKAMSPAKLEALWQEAKRSGK